LDTQAEELLAWLHPRLNQGGGSVTVTWEVGE
jgi:23S rRNA (adenine2030-N6)-methyltransferase